jgi:DNA-binding NtrC family response regulator
MPQAQRRQPPDLDFHRIVARAAFANPFGPEFKRLCAEIDPRTVPERVDRVPILEEAVAAKVAELDRDELGTIDAFTGKDRAVIRTVFLFHAYHRFYRQLDELILEQLRLGHVSVAAPFGREVLQLLHRRGLPMDEARRVLGIFYQLRRAHHFITRGLIGHSPSMQRFRGRLWENVFTHDLQHYEQSLWNRMEDFSTLLLGETGTGKGAAAAAIGRSAFIPFDVHKERFAESFTQAFVSLNLSQFPETLIESELFGHRKGAFTGAVDAHNGAFQQCSAHGAVFLDEIGDVSTQVQIKLLRVLEDRTFSPVGSRESLPFRGRVIAATHRPLAQLRAEGRFRDDFYYRLCSDTIPVPTLRERLREEPKELGILAAHILQKLAGKDGEAMTPRILKRFSASIPKDYEWPGNVRELEQALRRVLLTQEYHPEVRTGPIDESDALAAAVAAGTLEADALLARYCALLHRRFQTIEEVARRTALDRRTVKRYLGMQSGEMAES